MSIPEERRSRCRQSVAELREHMNTLARQLEANEDQKELIRSLAKCRATVNTMLAEVTGEDIDPEKEDGPAWKAAAARLTSD